MSCYWRLCEIGLVGQVTKMKLGMHMSARVGTLCWDQRANCTLICSPTS